MGRNELHLSFAAGCAVDDRAEAFLAALTALGESGQLCSFLLWMPGCDGSADAYRSMSVDAIVGAVRARFTPLTDLTCDLTMSLHSGGLASAALRSYSDHIPARGLCSSLAGHATLLTPTHLPVFTDGRPRSLEGEAAAVALPTLQDAEDLLDRLAGAEASRFCTAAHLHLDLGLSPPVEASGSYTRSLEEIARDLAAAWVYLHDGDHPAILARMPLEALRSRVEAAPRGAHVGVAVDLPQARAHQERERAAAHIRSERARRPGAVRSVPRARLSADVLLTREQVLKALATAPNILLEALEAAAVPDEEWRNAEVDAKQLLALGDDLAAPEVDVATGRHKHWIERHAPSSVRRLSSGGVTLTTHPYRTLWALWADALALLGIREADDGSE